ncbi:AAC(3) family N-acetyltransferase [Natroniella sp. ANB-PHB2]|uniref:AAC(3) family N-acetyltransferase n=1 Tax=Natroniella sp. ANB-PHB2 TaxID=3384444 RepID=UPI0038D41FB2
MKKKINKIMILKNRVKGYMRKFTKIDKKIGNVNVKRIEEIFSNYKQDAVFVHAGLSDIKKAFNCNPYKFLMELLEKNFDSIYVPGFTPSFRKSGVYHKSFSKPEHSIFNRLFLSEANYRTNDCIHSILVKGNSCFNDCNHFDTFSLDGCFGKMDQENILYLNIGTNFLKSTQLHYIERLLKVPYMDVTEKKGIIYYNETDYEVVLQKNYKYNTKISWNRLKLEKDMKKEKMIDTYDLNGLKVRFFKAGDLMVFLENKINKDPYYLVK